jgi:AraC-like DNA-binding protein
MVRATITQGATCCAQDGDFLQELEQSALVRRSLADFRRVTGLAAKLVPAALPTHLIKFGAQDVDFCRALGCSARACQACFRHQTDLLNRLDRKLKPQQTYCLAGLVHLAVPVLVSGRHIATVLGGKVRIGPGSERKFAAVERHLRRCGLDQELSELRRAWFRAPLLKRSQLRAAMGLLDQLTQLFAETIVRQPASRPTNDPPCVAEAKRFVRLHLGERLTTRQAAQALHLNESYFCRLFRRLSGMTFRAYLAKVRVEATQAALLNTHQSVGEIAYAAGFQSMPDFDRVFKTSTGVSPSQFRDQRRPHVSTALGMTV